MTTPSVVEVVGAGRIMSDLLGDRKIKAGLTNCINPAHPDKHPSMSIDLDGGVFNCFACGAHGGALDFAVYRGVGRDAAEAAKELAEKYHVGSGNGRAPAPPEEPWPYYPTTAERLGWSLTEYRDRPALRVPTWVPSGAPGRTKIRGQRNEDGDLDISFEKDALDCGVINLPALIDHSAGVESPSVAVLCGETDLLAWTWACTASGIQIPGISHATGEGSSFADYAQHFRGVRVYFFPDNDEKGRLNAPKRIAEFKAAGAASVHVLHPPEPHKDVRSYVHAHGKDAIAELIRLAEKTEKKPFQPTGAFDLLQKQLPPIEELVSPRIIYRGGLTLLVAAHKRGKSLASLTLSVDLVMNIACDYLGDPERCPKWLGQMCVGSGPVLVYSAEGGERMVQERLRAMMVNPGTEMNDVQVYAEKPTPKLDDPADLDAVFARAEEIGAVLIVFDPLGRFWSMTDEADPTAARNLMEAIQTKAEAAYNGRGIAVLLVHHDTKATGSDEDSAVTGGRGSGKFGDDADAIINLKVIKGAPAGQSKVMFLLRHAESPAPVTVTIDKKTLRLRQMAPDEIEAAKPITKPKGGGPKITLPNVERICRAKRRIRSIDIADLLGCSLGAWKNARKEIIDAMCSDGLFHKETDARQKTDFIVLTRADGGCDSCDFDAAGLA